MDITKIDKNFAVESELKRDGLVFYNIEDKKFSTSGFMKEDGDYVRMSKSVAHTVTVGKDGCSGGVEGLNYFLAGGRIRFTCDSPYIAVKLKIFLPCKTSHSSLTGNIGCDLYEGGCGNEKYVGTFIPPYDVTDEYESIIDLPTREMRDFTINLPDYTGVSEVYVGVKDDTVFSPAWKYKYENPVVFYGSSITQGGCASRPGNAYEQMLSAWLGFEYLNLGFSGNAKGETEMAEYIAGLKMSVFVCDYDHNAPTVEHLEKTHEPFFKTFRKLQPNIPVIIMSRPKHRLTDDDKKRLEIIRATYKNALANGDKNVYLIEGPTLIPESLSEHYSVDGIHPNDAGLYSMARVIEPLLKKLLENAD